MILAIEPETRYTAGSSNEMKTRRVRCLMQWLSEASTLKVEQEGRIMAKQNSKKAKHQIHEVGEEALEAAHAKKAGTNFEWYFGRVTGLGHFEIAGGRSVSIAWEGGGVSSQQGDISDEQWEIFKLAFTTSGRIAVLSDLPGEEALYDYRFMEAVR